MGDSFDLSARNRIAMTGARLRDDAGGVGVAAATLFALAWDTLADVLGTATAAALVRRGARRGADQSPELTELVVVREDLAYRYALPASWSHATAAGLASLRVLAREIGRLLAELTGSVVIRRLEQVPELRAAGLSWRPEEAN